MTVPGASAFIWNTNLDNQDQFDPITIEDASDLVINANFVDGTSSYSTESNTAGWILNPWNASFPAEG